MNSVNVAFPGLLDCPILIHKPDQLLGAGHRSLCAVRRVYKYADACQRIWHLEEESLPDPSWEAEIRWSHAGVYLS